MSGWIKLHRKIQEHWIWQDKPFDRRSAWVDILMMVNHENKKILLGNELIEVKRGSRITSIRQLCKRWGWSNTKVKRFLSLLENDNMLIVKSDSKKTTLIVVNYDDYQSIDDTKNDKETTQKRQRDDTETTETHTNKNDKNDKNDKNKRLYKEFVKLTDDEYQKLLDRFGETNTKNLIERLNNYIGSKGKKYKSHYHTILNWANKDNIQNSNISFKRNERIGSDVYEEIRDLDYLVE